MDPQTLNEYMKNKSPSHKYYTRSKARKFPFLLSILCFLMFLGISAASYTNSSISLITKGKAIRSVDLGSVFLCDKNKNLGLYGYPKVDFCGKEHTIEPTKFMGNVLQYFERQAEVNIYVCTYIVIDQLCYSRFFGSVDHTKIRKELRTDAQHCRNAKNSMVSPHGHPIS